jgi:hypothetical protein
MNGESMNFRDERTGELEQLRDRFEHWRQQNGPGRRRRIPGAFWSEASVLARRHGVVKVARTLRLDYATLKKKSGVQTNRGNKQASVPFVELMIPGPMTASESVVELTNRSGGRMTIRLQPHCGRDIVQLAELFLRGGK